ncbi:aluminum-activated malate transporter 8-like [Solanum tuberosum]|uniref:Aluminum-activated malate transporter n=1 Tax=Solanum tuberosum TaxID=4113 RepID=M1DEY4_SOLTU|nr:PREDICTED: aluminum-activated malate transporter 8-like [Solanum tuberosum]
MEIDSTNQENLSIFTKWWNKLKDFPRKFQKKIEKIAKNTKQIGKDDPRKIWHAFKVGLALTLVSLFYYTEPLFHNFDQPVMWAVLTVVVTFEFTAGATISKSINRGIGTALAGAFGLGAKYLAELIGREGPNPIILGVLVFIVGALGTFTRFYPHIKRRYDYGTMIFVLTFSLVAVSGYRSENIFQLAHRRISTILIGVFTVMIISMIIRPVWAGEDLHKLASTNLEKLASYLEGFGSEYFHISENKSVEGNNNNEKGFHEVFLSILGSKATEESLANLAWWEPPHGGFKFNHPWKQYLKIGSLVRKCACHLLALSNHINSKSQAPNEFERRTEEACKKMIMESKKALKELALSIKTMAQPISSIRNTKNVIDDLKLTLGTSKTLFQYDESRVLDFVPTASVVSLLISVTKCVDEISEAIKELSSKARFEKKSMSPPPPSRSHWPQILHRGTVNPIVEDEVDGGDLVTIEIGDNVESKRKVVVEEVNPIVEDDVDGGDFVTIEIGDNVESKGKVVVEEVNRVNNQINATKEESFVIWIRGSTAMAIVEEMKTPKKMGDFMDLVDIKLYNSTQFLESSEGVLTVLEGANQVNNPLTVTEGESVVIGIRGNTTTTKVEEMEMTKKKVELTDLTDIKFNNSIQFLESILMTVTTVVEEMKMTEKKETL